MEIRLRQLEETEPLLFARLVSLAVLENEGYGTPEQHVRIVHEVAPDLDDELAARIGHHITQWAVASMVWEGLR
jgi:hypothetical protein